RPFSRPVRPFHAKSVPATVTRGVSLRLEVLIRHVAGRDHNNKKIEDLVMHLRTSLGNRRNLPRVEALESRLALSVTASQLGNGTIIINGTANAEAIQINDYGLTTLIYANGNYVGGFGNSS